MNLKTKTKASIVGIISVLSFGGVGIMAGVPHGPVGMIAGLILSGVACISLLIASHTMLRMLIEKEG